MTDAMIDIETLSTANNAIILTIGAIKFNRYEKIKELKDMETFYVRICKESCENLGMDLDENTLKWWNSQNEKARYEALLNTDRTDIKLALGKLSLFLRKCNNIWANSPTFDCIILENAYKICNLQIPWKFWNIRDCRTVYDLANIKLTSVGETSHNSLEDCYAQIVCLKNCFKILKIKNEI